MRALAYTVFLVPTFALAHGGVDDGHIEEVVAEVPSAGASALLVPMSGSWFALLAVSATITALLSYGVYRYLQVPPVERNVDANKK